MINLNEVAAGLSYVGSSVKKCNIDNNIISLGADAKYEMRLDFSTSILPQSVEEHLKRGRVLLNIRCDVTLEEVENVQTSIDFIIEGEFSTSTDTPDDKFNKMLMINGVSALYGIARSKLEVITAMTYHDGKISFPMINVLELLKQKEENPS